MGSKTKILMTIEYSPNYKDGRSQRLRLKFEIEIDFFKVTDRVSRVSFGKSCIRALLSMKRWKTIYHCKAD